MTWTLLQTNVDKSNKYLLRKIVQWFVRDNSRKGVNMCVLQ